MKTFFYCLFGAIFTIGFIVGACFANAWPTLKSAIHYMTS